LLVITAQLIASLGKAIGQMSMPVKSGNRRLGDVYGNAAARPHFATGDYGRGAFARQFAFDELAFFVLAPLG
jgi:hypothetical protein